MNAFLKNVRWGFLAITAIVFLGVTQEKVWAHPDEHYADPNAVLVEVFERDDCQHCQDLKQFLKTFELKSDNPHIEVISHNIRTESGRLAFEQVTKKEGLTQSTPIVLIGTQVIQGFDQADTTGVMIERFIRSQVGEPRIGLGKYLTLSGGGNRASRGWYLRCSRRLCTRGGIIFSKNSFCGSSGCGSFFSPDTGCYPGSY